MRPNGKLTMEVPTADFPQIETASRCAISHLCFLNRRGGGPARVEPMTPEEAVDVLMRDGCYYGQEVLARHERGFRRLAEAPAYRLCFQTLDEGVRLLVELSDGALGS
jgi:hypothetical protein